MKKRNAALYLFAACMATSVAAHAKSYAGFDLCGPATQATLKSTIEGAGGAVARVIDQTYPDELIVIAKNMPVDATPRSVSVTLYKGKVAHISIGNATDMVRGLEAKYGNKYTTSKKEEKFGVATNHHFQDPADETLELIISQIEIPNQQGVFFSVNYACKDLYKQVESAREAYKKPGVKK